MISRTHVQASIEVEVKAIVNKYMHAMQHAIAADPAANNLSAIDDVASVFATVLFDFIKARAVRGASIEALAQVLRGSTERCVNVAIAVELKSANGETRQ